MGGDREHPIREGDAAFRYQWSPYNSVVELDLFASLLYDGFDLMSWHTTYDAAYDAVSNKHSLDMVRFTFVSRNVHR